MGRKSRMIAWHFRKGEGKNATKAFRLLSGKFKLID